MKQLLNIPHRASHGMCPANEIHDLVHWRTSRERYFPESLKCYACINDCPSRAIQIQSKFPIRSNTDMNDRYHHRLVTFKDIAQRR